MIKSRAAGFDLVANQIQEAIESKKVLPGRAGDAGVDNIQLFLERYLWHHWYQGQLKSDSSFVEEEAIEHLTRGIEREVLMR
jgi:hypothetical protein